MVDADNFKQVNTRFGHLTGDYVLAEIAAILRASIRGSDAAICYGGDEFLVLLADTTAIGAQNVIERIKNELNIGIVQDTSRAVRSACPTYLRVQCMHHRSFTFASTIEFR